MLQPTSRTRDGLSRGEGVADEFALGGVIFRAVVVGGVDVVGPGGRPLRGCDAAHAGAQAGKGFEQNLADDLGVCQGARHGGGAGCRSGIPGSSPGEENGQSDGGERGLLEALCPREGGVDLLGLEAVATA